MTMVELDPEEKQKRSDCLMEHTKEEIAIQWVTLGSDMKQKYDKLKIEFEYKIANDISRFFEAKDKLDTLVHAMQNRSTTEGNITEKTESPF